MPMQSLPIVPVICQIMHHSVKDGKPEVCSSEIHGDIPLIARKHKLTGCDSRDAETAEDEQENSLHVSNARTTCGPIYSGPGVLR